MIKEKLTEKELALIDVLEDPVLLPEFLRSTRDGSMNVETWPKRQFAYRWYQRDLLSDNSPKIVLRGGRAIGKCQPEHTRILTTDGYKTIRKIRQENKSGHTTVWCFDDQNRLVQRRAIIRYDTLAPVYLVTLKNGYQTKCTKNHPFLTPNGYAELELLKAGDAVAILKRIPDTFHNETSKWAELRYLGYICLHWNWTPERTIKPKNEAIRRDLFRIAELMDMSALEGPDGIKVARKKNLMKHFFSSYAIDLGFQARLKAINGIDYAAAPKRTIPAPVLRESTEQLKVFLEAMFAQHAEITRHNVSVFCYQKEMVWSIQEVLLRLGIESRRDDRTLIIDKPKALYRFFTELTIPGVGVGTLNAPPEDFDPADHYRFEEIESIILYNERIHTYAVYVYDFHNYIADGMVVHNSLVLEDKIIYQTLNQHTEFHETKEMLLATANQAQMEPVLGRVITRFTSSPLLKDFLGNRVNRSLGVMDFRFSDVQYLIRSRIAGKDDANLVGLHVNKMYIDEAQLFNTKSWTQLAPANNSWEVKNQLFFTGVPNGGRNSLLYHADKKLSGFKTYVVPAHNNPYYTMEDDLDNIKRYGGRETDDYVQLVLGGHGRASYTVITRDQIDQQPYDFYRFVYSHEHVSKNKPFQEVLSLPELHNYPTLCAGIDCGFVDPTVISIMGMQTNGQWRVLVRYVLKRIDYKAQEDIIHWLHRHYKFDKIGIDAASGGGGASILHSLLYRQEFSSMDYSQVLVPVMFGERIPVGFDTEGKELSVTTKSFGAGLLIQQLQQKTLVVSEIDYELISELERITKQKGISGTDVYYIMNEKGAGKADDDHNFASMICFCIATRDMSFQKKKRKRLGKTSGKF